MHLSFSFVLIKCPQPSWLNIMNQTEWYPLPFNFFLVIRLYYLQPTWLGIHLWSVAFISFLSGHMSQSSSSRVFQTTLMISRPPSMISTKISIWNWHWLSFLLSVSVWGFKHLLNYAEKSASSEDSKAGNNFNSILKVVTLQLRNFLKVLTLQLWPFNGALSLLCLRCPFSKSHSVFLCRIFERL